MAVNEMFFDKYPDTVLEHQIQVCTGNPFCRYYSALKLLILLFISVANYSVFL